MPTALHSSNRRNLAFELDGQITKLLLDTQLGRDVFVLVVAEDLTENVRNYHYRVALIPACELRPAQDGLEIFRCRRIDALPPGR